MSNFFLCNRCKFCDPELGVMFNEVLCEATGTFERAKVMLDHHGKNGLRYEEPTKVCSRYAQREDK